MLDLFVFEQYEVCEPCLFGKMTKTPFIVHSESDLLGFIHSDVYGPLNKPARGDFQYFITFNDNFSRYDCVYLMKHKFGSLKSLMTSKMKYKTNLAKILKHFDLIKEENI